jgi:hypothetical protein
VRRFASEVRIGDVAVLRSGTSTAYAVGIVASDYQYLPLFDDVNGWDLQHARRVRWAKLPQPHQFDGKVFGANPPPITRVQVPEVVEMAEQFVNSPPDRWQVAELPPLPAPEPVLGAEDVPERLRDVVAQVQDLVPLYRNQRAFGRPPVEDELLVHFVVPLLRALGWSVEKIAVKWRYVDVTLFVSLPRAPDSVAYIVEAKGLGAGVEGALGQAKRYMKQLSIQRDIVVTDGARYRLYAADQGFEPVAYANLERLKHGAVRLFEQMSAQRWNH